MTGCVSPTPTPKPVPSQAPVTQTPKPQLVELVMGSWRTEDVEQMNVILGKFHEKYPNITVRFDPTSAPDYDQALQAQLVGGTAPDLFYLRSFAISRKLYEAGYLEPLSNVAGLKENFSPEMRAPWTTDSGLSYGVPFIATSHAIYYNQDLFKKAGVEVPTTWQALLQAAEKLKAAQIIPFANASGDTWTTAELMFMNVAPNFLGGYDGRMAYLAGKRCFNDSAMVSAFQAMADLAPFLPSNQASLKYTDSQQLFLQGRAAMWLSGSWDIPFFEDAAPAFKWDVFAPPPPAGQKPFITFHLDAGMGLSANSRYKAEAQKFLEWMTSSEFGALLGNELPGFFPMHQNAPQLNNVHANHFLALNQSRGTDIRFVWEKLRDGQPDAYGLVERGASGVLRGYKTPQEAADELQKGLETWYDPAKKCHK